HRRFMENECSRMDAVVKAAGYARAAWVGDVNGIANDLQEHMHALALALDAYRAPQDAKPTQAASMRCDVCGCYNITDGQHPCAECRKPPQDDRPLNHQLQELLDEAGLVPKLNGVPIRLDAKPTQAECWRCNGTGKLRFEAANQSSPCPNCGGSGKQAEACEGCEYERKHKTMVEGGIHTCWPKTPKQGSGNVDTPVDACQQCAGTGLVYIHNLAKPRESYTTLCKLCGGDGKTSPTDTER